MRVFLSLLFVLLSSQVVAASKSKVIAACNPAIEKNDAKAIKKAAIEILLIRKVRGEDKKDTAILCLNSAFGGGWIYDEDLGTFVNDNSSTFNEALTSMNNEQRRKYDKLNEIAKQQILKNVENKRKVLEGKQTKAAEDRMKQLLKEQEELNAKNKTLIAEDTLKACFRLYQEDELAPFLNPICQNVFAEFGHPKLER
jgi:hypothetical protein